MLLLLFAMKIRAMIQISLFAVMTAIGARLTIPVPILPFTLQTLFAMLAGLVLGKKNGAASQLLYMAMGLAGIPVFTSICGPAAVFAPSFGYITGFVLCAYISGALKDLFIAKYGKATRLMLFTAAIAGVAATYAVGVTYLYAALNIWGGGAALMKVLTAGFFTTFPGDIIKAAAAAEISHRLAGSGITAGRITDNKDQPAA